LARSFRVPSANAAKARLGPEHPTTLGVERRETRSEGDCSCATSRPWHRGHGTLTTSRTLTNVSVSSRGLPLAQLNVSPPSFDYGVPGTGALAAMPWLPDPDHTFQRVEWPCGGSSPEIEEKGRDGIVVAIRGFFFLCHSPRPVARSSTSRLGLRVAERRPAFHPGWKAESKSASGHLTCDTFPVACCHQLSVVVRYMISPIG